MIKVAGIQMSSGPIKEENIKKALRMAEVAVGKGAKIICFPELFNTHFFPCAQEEENFELAEDRNGETVTTFSRFCKEKEVVAILPIFEKGRDSHYNSAFVIDADGRVLGSYRKIHIPQLPLWEERFYFSEGNLGFPVFNTKYAKIGIQISWDNFFPEGSRILTLKGAEIIFSPTSNAYDTHPKWLTVITANAIVNNLHIMRVNRVGREEKQEFYGRSFFVSPEGEVLAEMGKDEGILIGSFYRELNDLTRRDWNFFRDRRPLAYLELLGMDIISLIAERLRDER